MVPRADARSVRLSGAAPETGGSAAFGTIATLGTLLALASISTDLYLPAMPGLATSFHVSSSRIQLTLSTFLIGFSLGQLLWGPISDRLGRRVPMLCGLALFIAGCAGCALAQNADQIIAWRVVQALGACSGPVLARAMVRDLYDHKNAAQMLSLLMLIMAIAPLLGPMIGAEIIAVSTWRTIFWTLCGVGAAIALAVAMLPETLEVSKRSTIPIGHAFGQYADLLRDRALLAYAAAGGFFYAGIYAYVAGTPFAYISYYHLSPEAYGPLFAVNIVGLMAVNLVNARLIARMETDRLLLLGAFMAAASGLIVAVTALTGWGGVAGLAVPLFVYNAMVGPIIANSVAGALERAPDRLGAASALVGAMHYGAGVIGAAMVAILADGTPWTMGWIIAAGGVASALTAMMIGNAAAPSRAPDCRDAKGAAR